jgi:hypothetical protein
MLSSIKGLSIKDLNILCTYILIIREENRIGKGCRLVTIIIDHFNMDANCRKHNRYAVNGIPVVLNYSY